MKPALIYLFAIFFFTQLSYGQQQNSTKPDSLMPKQLHPHGRYAFDNRHELELISSAAHFGFSFTGERIALLSSPMVKGSARMSLEKCINKVKKAIDGKYPADVPVATFFF
jgi:hypothetical protein